MTNAQFIFDSLNKQDMIYVVAFMEENKTCSLNNAINWLFEVINVYGEDFVCERDHDLPSAEQMKQYRIDISSYNEHLSEDEALPF